ncbi:beta-propeller fold lactonase family protein [Burkholderia sp. Cy-637]|uniref:YncE family protein n=1 Tax=Burkholderia sp. Cy-637 TaxID=2608327 RepID=UPI0014245318|nr:beta-propeller fold lactonase family protein [Burkholderia sp. Cy-637]NIF91435.1 beta-propeller fold lactonase family protein [Burkholderia sp. Cy-637]
MTSLFSSAGPARRCLVAGTLALWASIGAAQVPPGGAVYLAGNQGSVTVLNAVNLKPIASIPLAGAAGAYSLQASPSGQRVYGIAYASGPTTTATLFAIDTASNRVVATAVRANSTTAGFALPVGSGKLYTNGNQTHQPPVTGTGGIYKSDAVVNVLDAGTLQPLKQIVIATLGDGSGPGAAITASPDGSRIYAANVNYRSIAVIDAQTDTLLATIDTSSVNNGYPASLAVTPDGSKLFLAQGFNGTEPGRLAVIDTASRAIVKLIDLPGAGPRPASLSISPDGQQLYVANGQADFPSHQNGLFVVDVATLAVTRSLAAPDDVFSFTNSGVAQDGYRILFNPSYTSAGQTGLLSLDPAENRISARVLLPAGANWSSGLAVVPGNRACATAR